MIDVHKYVVDNNIDPAMTAVNDLDFRTVIQVLKINIAVEIGTWHGTSAAYMAQFANHVYTFDVVDRINRQMLNELGLSDKITSYVVRDKQEIWAILQNIDFDFAFIDDGHSYEECAADFALVKGCNRVLIHDVTHPAYPGVAKFADEIGVRRLLNNGYWGNF